MNKQVKVITGEEAIKTILGLISESIEEKIANEKENLEEVEEEKAPSFLEFLQAIAEAKGLTPEDEECEDEEDYDEECDCTLCTVRDFCNHVNNDYDEEEEDDEEDEEVPSFPNFLADLIQHTMDKVAEEQRAINFKHEEKEDKKSQLEYSFADMVKEFENGFTGAFTNEAGDVIKYDRDSKALLIVTEVGVYPATITSNLLGGKFTKKEIIISNGKALELAREGEEVYFSVDIFGTEVEGHISFKDNMPSFKIYNQLPGMRSETIVLMALFNGTWSL